MICSTCEARITDSVAILSKGRWDLIKHNNRVCKYAREREKHCENPCHIIDSSLSWEAQQEQLEQDFQKNLEYMKHEV